METETRLQSTSYPINTVLSECTYKLKTAEWYRIYYNNSLIKSKGNMVQFGKPGHLHLVFFLSLISINLSRVLTTKEGEALVKWKNSLAPSPLLDSWSLTNLTSLCTWTGIICNSAGSVSEIDLSQHRLMINGTLAMFSFTSFPNLNTFNIRGNNFMGPIPPGVENLAELQYLDFGNNNLSGSIPYQISHLQGLRTLDLSNNHLEASNWSDFSPMPFLTTLYLGSNNLASKFPEFISNCHNLTSLYLSVNMLTGDLGRTLPFNKLNKLEFLDICSNSFEGPFPPDIINLSKLRYLDLGYNNFSGSIPDDIRMLSDLENLYLCSNSFKGTIPSSIGQLTKLQLLHLYDNHLNSSIPLELGFLTNLKFLYLHNNTSLFQ